MADVIEAAESCAGHVSEESLASILFMVGVVTSCLRRVSQAGEGEELFFLASVELLSSIVKEAPERVEGDVLQIGTFHRARKVQGAASVEGVGFVRL